MTHALAMIAALGLALGAAACGKYGPPERAPEEPAAPTETLPPPPEDEEQKE